MLFSKEFNSFAVNDQDLTRAKTPARLNNMTVKIILICRQGLNLSKAFSFSNANHRNSEIYRFEQVHFSNRKGLLRGLPRWEPPNRPTNEMKTESLYRNLLTTNACFKKFITISLINAQRCLESSCFWSQILTPKLMKLLWLLKLRVCTFSDPHTQNKDQFCTKTVSYLST